jgi:cytochrome b
VADGRSAGGEIRVWDLFVRVFHWGTAALVGVAFLTEDMKSLHEAAGYVVLPLVLARIAWGFVGPRHARFSDFVTRPATTLAYLRALRAGRAPRFFGHNPAGGAMVVALLALLVVVAGSGWMSETDRWFGVPWVADLHAAAANLLFWLVGLHVAGVVLSSWLHRENLIRAMFTGRKSATLPSGQVQHEDAPAAGARLRPR